MLVQGVEGEDGGLGYFGFSYYEQNADNLGLVSVDGGDGCVKPSKQTIARRRVHAAVPAAVHVPEREGAQEARGQGIHGLRGAGLEAISEASADRPDELQQAGKATSALGAS